MAILMNGTKATVAAKTAKGLVKSPGARRGSGKTAGAAAKLGLKAGKTRTKGKLAVTAAKPLVKSGVASKAAKTALAFKVGKPAVKSGLAFKVAKPLAKRRAKQQLDWVGDAAEWVSEAAERVGEVAAAVTSVIAAYGPDAARQLGLVEPPPAPKRRTAPWLMVGVVIGAAGAYFLDPEHGSDRRKQVAGLVGQ